MTDIRESLGSTLVIIGCCLIFGQYRIFGIIISIIGVIIADPIFKRARY